MISPLKTSILIHSAILLLVGAIIWGNLKIKPDLINVPVVFETVPETTQITTDPKISLKSVNQVKVKPTSREIFGANRNSYTDSEGSTVVKKGNTITKEVDNEELKESDADSLPSITDEYLVSTMPKVLVEIKPNYPQIAKAQNQEGKVVMDIIVDQLGAVRQVTIISGEEVFKSEAILAMKKFKFSPALVEGKPVAVKIRYVLKFVLEF